MCKVYNTVGALTTIKTRLAQNKIDGFHSCDGSAEKFYSLSH
jgi:hypothetical protein